MPCSPGSGSQLAGEVHLHQSLGPPELCHKQLCVCGAALHSHPLPSPGQQGNPWAWWNSGTGLPHCLHSQNAAGLPHGCTQDKLLGKEAAVSQRSEFPQIWLPVSQNWAANASTASHREGLWQGWNLAGEQNPLQLPTLETKPEENGFQQFHSSQKYLWVLL